MVEKCQPPANLLQDRPPPACRLAVNDDFVACLRATRQTVAESNADKASLRQWSQEACR